MFHAEYFVLASLYVQWRYVYENEAADKKYEEWEGGSNQSRGR